ncbi:MAG: CpaE family protein [Asticcacaulis sp.]
MSGKTQNRDPFDDDFDLEDRFGLQETDSAELDLSGDFRLAEEALSVPFDDTDDSDTVVEAQSAPTRAPSASTAAGISMDALPDNSDGSGITIPRISIHLFTLREDTQVVAQRVASDRRLSRAEVLCREGGLSAAIESYQDEPTPSLIIVETDAPQASILAQMDALSEVCDAGTRVIVLSALNDIRLYRELMGRGVSEYLVTPVQPVQLIRTIGSLYADPASPFVGRTLAFVGARGGSGSSTLAHNLSHMISQSMQANTVLVDCDLPFGTAGLDFNQDPAQGLADALRTPDRLDPVLLDRMLARCSERLSLFAAPAVLDQDFDIDATVFEDVSQKIRKLAPYVVMDLPHQWSAWVRRQLLTADDVVIVAVPDLASLRNTKNMVDLIRAARPNDAPPRLILNQVGVPGRPEIPAKDFAAAVGIAPSVEVPFDAKLFGDAANNGQMLVEIGAKTKAVEALEAMTRLMTGREVVQPKPTSFLSRLLKR